MEKENKLATEQETKENEIVELKDEEMETIIAGADDSAIFMSDAMLVAPQASKLGTLENE